MRKWQTFAESSANRSDRPQAEAPSVRTDLRRPPEAGIRRRPRPAVTDAKREARACATIDASFDGAVAASRSLMAPGNISQFIASQSGCAAPSGLSQSRSANALDLMSAV